MDMSVFSQRQLAWVIDQLISERDGLRAANTAQQATITQLRAEVQQLVQPVEQLETELAQRDSGESSAGARSPSWIKPNKPVRAGGLNHGSVPPIC